jgi:molecular chaperone GrpE
MFNRKPQPESAPEPAENAGGGTREVPGHDEDMHTQVLRLSQERDEAVLQWKRALADFQNYQRRALQNEQEAKKQGTTSVLMSVLPVLDHFDLALTQQAPDESSKKILHGVQVIRAELLRVLENHGVTVLNPQPGDEFDPNRHSAIMQPVAEGVKPGHVSATFRPGYAMGERVIRSAKVAVAPSAPQDENYGKPNDLGEFNLDE